MRLDFSQSITRITALLAAVFALACAEEHEDAEGDVVCDGAECQCPSTGDCRVDCGAECDLSCTGSGDCDFSCGADCVASCPGSGACLLSVDHGSSVDCPGSGGCDVTCHGDCSVECPGSGECIVRCGEEASCSITRCEDVVTCADGVQVCNGACPE